MTDETGYDRLRATLDEAHARPGINGTVRIEIAGERPRDLVTGDHVGRDGAVHLGGGLVVDPDSTIVGSDGDDVVWRGGHAANGGLRVERFLIRGRAMSISWIAIPLTEPLDADGGDGATRLGRADR